MIINREYVYLLRPSSPQLRGARRSGRGEFAFLFAVAILPPPSIAGVSRPLRDYVVIGCEVIVGKLRDTDDESARISRARHFLARPLRTRIEISAKQLRQLENCACNE